MFHAQADFVWAKEAEAGIQVPAVQLELSSRPVRSSPARGSTQLAPLALSFPPEFNDFFLYNSGKELLSALTKHQVMRQGTREPQIMLQNLEQKMKAPTMSTQPGGAVYHNGLLILQMKGGPLPSFR